MTLSVKFFAIAFLVGAIVAGAAITVNDYLHVRRQDAAVQQAAAGVAAARVQVTVTDTVYRTDTATFHQVLETTDTVRAHVVITDTASVRRALVQDSVAIRSCQRVVTSCEARVAARDKLIDSLGRQVSTLEAVVARPAPRLVGSASLGFEPVVNLPHVTATEGFRVAGSWYLEGRASYTWAPGERPRFLALLTRRF